MMSEEQEKQEPSLQAIHPNHDFLGIIGIQYAERTIIYGILPRFWRNSVPKQYCFKGKVRLLKQNQEILLPLEEAIRLELAEKQIKAVFSEDLEEDPKEPDNPVPEPQTSENPISETELLASLYQLCQYYHKEKRQNKELRKNTGSDSHGLPIFLFEDFLNQLTPKIRELRRSYRPVVEEIGTVRGRITRRGMINCKAKPSPRIECEFETFDINSPIYRVLVTTLENIAAIDVFGADSAFDFLRLALQKEEISIKERAISLRRKMSEIPSLSVPKAISLCAKFLRRPPRAFRGFQSLMQLSYQILMQQYQIIQENEQQKWWHITAPSSKIWELLLEKSLQKIPNLTLREQFPLEGPWIYPKKSGSKNIDLCIQIEQRTWLLDAKYAHYTNTPDTGYQYQQFFYATAYQQQFISEKTNEKLEAIGLLHATIEPETEQNNCFEMHSSLQSIWNDHNLQFYILNLYFPQAKDIQASAHLFLEDYFHETSLRLKNILDLS